MNSIRNKFVFLAVLTLYFFHVAKAQEKASIWKNFDLSGYTEVYYASYSDSLGANALQKFATTAPRDQRFSLNIVQVGIHYQDELIRGNLTLHYGDIPKAIWDPDFPMLQEANIGVKFANEWWVDAGFFRTHIGTESFLPKDNFTTSTTVASYNEPFYQSGVRITYEGSDMFDFQFWVVNGYNYFLDANNAKSVGLLFSYSLREDLQLTYTNLFGRESLDSFRPKQYRTYHNLYLNYNPFPKTYITVGGDVGTQSHSQLVKPDKTAIMYNALATVRYQFTNTYSLTGRVETFQDPDGFISGTYEDSFGNMTGLQLMGYTLSTEYKPTSISYVRLEGRWVRAKDDLTIFYQNGPTNDRLEASVSMGFVF
ncbi:porin [Echinicola soli]|uniref:Porin n=1 Tax=Echinicola soli TaxID=2591634 RepID=A0A514CDJ7_9BACT|nr:outer membrane beta-barrel protein [Echinicola soli]QDH77886.1 porin [Echinicola soli]